ncbi:RND family transporter [Campylobacter sp. LR264d]|uniref:efflux RND transporter permease subunit n=1 Tax=Campylobacter sp. LR264d TaxID=2593544 RepID=UPI0012396293|nr:MMPL family transporter [Campylobacter sp. LR264d]KAA6229842.1 RND family transporter [Campylobacter sp. LR264d]
MLARILKILINNAKITFFATLALCLFLSFFAFKLSVDASAESLLLEDDKDLKVFRELSKHYKSDNFLMLAFKPSDENPFSTQSLNELESLHKSLEEIFQVKKVLSIINAPLLQSTNENDLKELLKHIPTIRDENINFKKAKDEILNSPFYRLNLISKDSKFLGLIIYLEPDLTYANLIETRDSTTNENEKAKLRLAIKKHQDKQRELDKQTLISIKELVKSYENKGHTLYLGGINMIADDMIAYIKSDLALYGLSLIFLLGLALWYFFRSFYFIILPLFICFISLSSASGLFALFDFQITVISSNYVALVLIITLSVIVHLITHFVQTSSKYPNAKLKRVVLQTLLAKAKPSFFAIFTTIIGFLSLIFSNIQPIIQLGIMMSIGIAFSLILSYLFLASMLVLFNIRIYRYKDFNANFLNFCANASLKYRKMIFLLAIIGVFIALWGISSLKVENSFVNYFKDGSDIKKGLLVIDRNLGGTIPLEVVINFEEEKKEDLNNENLDFESEFNELAKQDTYFFNAKKTRIAKKVHEFLANKEFVGSILSLNSLLELGKKVNDGKELDDFALAFLNENLPGEFKQELLSSYVSIENNELRFVMRIVDSDTKLRRNEFLLSLNDELKELLKDDGVKFQLTGIMLLYNNMLQSLFASQFNTLSFVILAIFVLFVLIFRNLKLALIAILVNVIPLSIVFALMGIFEIPLDIMSITIAAIAIGIGVDDALHYIYRFKEEIKHKGIKYSIRTTHLAVGSALYYTSISIILGFSVMLTSNFIPTIYFGILTIFVMFLLLSGSLFLLPSFLSTLTKPKRY